ncbi:MAG: ATP-binding cassette domain-containing protein [Pseudomonadota bacterium]
MVAPLLKLDDIHLTFGGTPLLTGADLQVNPGDRICLVGRNGSGKSTLMKIAADLVEPDRGERFLQPGIHVAYLAQEPNFGGAKTVGDYVDTAFSETEDPYQGRRILETLGLTGEEDPSTLSGGEGRRAAIAHTLGPKPDIVLLDEPTNHLDLPTISWLESYLADTRSAMVLISHDRRFLNALSQRTVWIDRGVARELNKGFQAFEQWRDDVLDAEAEASHKRDRKIAREESWMQGGVSGRRKRNMRRVGELQALRQEKREARAAVGSVRLEATEAQTSGKLVVEADNLDFRYPDGPHVIQDLSMRMMRGDRVGLIGPNGAGKTTLLKVLIGELEPDTGRLRFGANLETVWLDQKRETLSETATLTDVLTGGRGDTVFVNGRSRHVASYLKDFLFLPEQARSPVKVLSGGERARLMLAKALCQPSNLLVLDEPTNDLDLETLDLLQELLSDYTGTLLLVSHDRDFIDRVCTSVMVTEGQGKWREYPGGFSDMVSQASPDALTLLGLADKDKRSRAGNKKSPKASNAKPGVGDPNSTPARHVAKLSYKEKYALETLPKEIAQLEASIASLETELGDPNLFSKKPERFQAASKALTEAQNKLAEAETRWLELEMRREELEG